MTTLPSKDIHTDVEAVAPHRSRSIHETHVEDEKVMTEIIEDVKTRDNDDPNSPEAILARYPLLRDMSQAELDQLNHKVRRRM